MTLKENLQKIYDGLPKMTPGKCAELCKSGKCKNECCRKSACSRQEKHLINRFLARSHLNLPFVNEIYFYGYLLPHTGTQEEPKCAYLKDGVCAIYEVRPALCRLFGAIKEMSCSHFPEEAKIDMPPSDLVKIGLLSEEEFKTGRERFREIWRKIVIKKGLIGK
jgi:Fe-S-cluster containining protein